MRFSIFFKTRGNEVNTVFVFGKKTILTFTLLLNTNIDSGAQYEFWPWNKLSVRGARLLTLLCIATVTTNLPHLNPL